MLIPARIEEFLLCNFIEITLLHGWSTVNLLRFSGTPFMKNTYGGLPLDIYTIRRNTQFLVSCPSPQIIHQFYSYRTYLTSFHPDSPDSHPYSYNSHPNSPHSHPDSPHSHPDSPHSLHFHPDSPHSPYSHPDSPHSHHSPHSVPWFPILAFTDSRNQICLSF